MGAKLDNVLNRAVRFVNQLKHVYITPEVLLYALLDEPLVLDVVRSICPNFETFDAELEDYVNDITNFNVMTETEVESLSFRQFGMGEKREAAKQAGILYQPELTGAVNRIVQRAVIQAMTSGRKETSALDTLSGFFMEKCWASEHLAAYKITRQQILEAITKVPESIASDGQTMGERLGGDPKKPSAIEAFTANLNKQAEEKKIDPVIGRGEETKRAIQILCRRRKNNPLLVGEAGTGKTAIAEGLAQAIVNKTVPEVLNKTTIYNLDLAALMAGAKYRGDVEERLKALLGEIADRFKQGLDSVLFIDEIHMVMGAGAVGGSSMDVSNLLKPALSRGELKVMGATTHEEFRKSIEKNAAFNRRFQKIDVNEPNLEDTFKILQGLRSHYEKHHNVKYSDKILRLAVHLSNKHVFDRYFPDKAIDVIDEAGAAQRLLPTRAESTNITTRDIETVVSIIARIPRSSVSSDEKLRLRSLKDDLSKVIYGQDEAVKKVADAIVVARSGLANETQPMGKFLFAGPTGVGKTELAKQLAATLGLGFIRYDMSEYMESHASAKLIGAPPGYVGYEEGGLLTDAIRKQPYCVLLLDEMEKAHPDTFNILLQIMDNGFLTDSQGRRTSFKNTVLIMTTNAGARETESGSIGFEAERKVNTTKRDLAIKRTFTPEFRNRLDAIVQFNKLGTDLMLKIVDKFLGQVQVKLAEKKVELTVDEAARNWLAEHGFDPTMGARPLQRIIDNEVKKPLASEMLFGKLEKGGKVNVGIKNKILVFDYE